ncbi:MAG: hypothetical protein QM662_08535 [Gordonia sp. (in: high G+C Gram-positive bacteria)]
MTGPGRTPFEPAGVRSRKEILVDLFGERDEDSVVTYAEIAEAIGIEDRPTCQRAVNGAKSSVERVHNKALDAVTNVGYRIVRAGEHLQLAQRHQKRGRSQLRRSQSKVVHVDMSRLTDGERAAVTLAATSIGLQMEYMRRNDIRSGRIEEAVAAVQDSTERSESEIAELKERLARLEQETTRDC